MATTSKRKGSKADAKIGGQRHIFISHSWADKEFAKMLDATLLAGGAKTFLAERDIRVGDSIPESIYRGIDIATDLIYVVSLNSVQSPWVQEELSIAKMRQKQSSGFRVFPLLIDDLKLPASILHVKYADFRAWRKSQNYRESCLELMDALNIAPHVIDRNELRWYATHADKLNSIIWDLAQATGVLEGALDGDLRDSLDGEYRSTYTPTKYMVEGDSYDIFRQLANLCDLIVDDDADVSTRLRTLRESAQKASTVIRSFDSRREYNNVAKVEKFRWALSETFHMLRELKDEVETSLLSTTLFQRPASLD